MSSLMTLALAFASAVLSASLQDAPVRPMAVPRGSEPTLDGVLGEDEWRDAATLARSGTATLLVQRVGDTLFLGLRGVGPGITTLGLASEDGTRLFILHASASLGTAEYERDGERWTLVHPFTWGAKLPPGTAEGDAARAAFRGAEGWLGTLTTMGTGGSEIAIDVNAGGWAQVAAPARLRIALGHLGGTPIRLPEGSSDDLFGLGLQMGTPPSALTSQPSTWLALDWDDGPPELAGLHRVDAGNAWVYGQGPEEARELATDVEAAAREFERYFGRAPEAGAVVAVPGATLPPGCDAELRAAGARWVLPWLSMGEQPGQTDSLRSQIETQLRAQLEPLGMSDEQIAEQLEQVLSRLSGTTRGGLGLLRHELGHLWFLTAFWGDAALAPSPAPAAHRYAGPAADWLDETAAILLESPEATALRRSSFATWRAANPGQLRPLDELFTMAHPVDVGAVLEAAPPDAAQNGSVTVVVNAGPASEEQQLRLFYEECRSLADYLLETGGERIFVPIAESAARGEDMTAWLAAEGAQHGLPERSADLQSAWRAWLDAQPAVPGELETKNAER